MTPPIETEAADQTVPTSGRTEPSLLVITPCHNDGWALAGLAASLLAQDLAPRRWLVVDDSSTDETPDQMAALEAEVPFLTGLRRDREPGRRISEKARAIMYAYATVDQASFDYVAIVDADVELPADYFTRIHAAMEADRSLGVTGGMYVEFDDDGQLCSTGRVSGHHVPGAAQVFRRELFDSVGGYEPLPYGGDDVVSVTRVRMLGHRTGAMTDLQISHGRRMGTGGHGSPLRADRNLGRQDYDLGTWLPFELVKLVRHIGRRPVLLAAGARTLGYLELAIRRAPRSIDSTYHDFVRDEQRGRVTRRVGAVLRGWSARLRR